MTEHQVPEKTSNCHPFVKATDHRLRITWFNPGGEATDTVHLATS